MIQIAICDDERTQRKILKEILAPWLELQGIPYDIREFCDGSLLYEEYLRRRFDLIFLDIEMDGMNGMETAKKLRAIDMDGILIFVTAYPDYVFQGYEVRAFHYILKPYQEKKILRITEEAIKEIQNKGYDYYLLPQGAGSYRLNLQETLYFSSDGRYIIVSTLRGEKRFRAKLDDLEKELPDFFQRIHQRYLVNLKQIGETGEHFVMIGNQKLPVSRAHKQAFLIAFARIILNGR